MSFLVRVCFGVVVGFALVSGCLRAWFRLFNLFIVMDVFVRFEIWLVGVVLVGSVICLGFVW